MRSRSTSGESPKSTVRSAKSCMCGGSTARKPGGGEHSIISRRPSRQVQMRCSPEIHTMATHTVAPDTSLVQPSEMRLPKLNLRDHGLKYAPAIPVDLAGMVDTLFKLGSKVKERE